MPEADKIHSPYMETRDAVQYIGLKSKNSDITIRRWAQRGLIQHGRAGRKLLFKKEWLDNFILAGKFR